MIASIHNVVSVTVKQSNIGVEGRTVYTIDIEVKNTEGSVDLITLFSDSVIKLENNDE